LGCDGAEARTTAAVCANQGSALSAKSADVEQNVTKNDEVYMPVRSNPKTDDLFFSYRARIFF
jgi:hypothetical protein